MLATHAGAADRTLHWRALDVGAHLDRDGRLHVRERHTMVFSGAWNGGERRFRVGEGQRLQLERLSRLDPATGAVQPLEQGDLSRIGQYRWSDGETLRWRSRLASDPPFHETERVYEIEYVLSGILVPANDVFLLNHDFAFPDRPGPIRRFTLDLRWDPAWEAVEELPEEIARQDLRPGQSAVVAATLRYVADGSPREVGRVAAPTRQSSRGVPPEITPAPQPATPAFRHILAVAFIAFVAWRAAAFVRHEKRSGRYEPLVPLERIDGAWLEENVLELPPEVVGAAWDKTTSAPEVAALLARLSAEGKLTSELEEVRFLFWRREVLHLALKCGRDELRGYERKLVDALFFDGDTTDTDGIRAHYREEGLSPPGKIRGGLSARVKRLGGETIPAPSWRLSAGLAVAAAVSMGIELAVGVDFVPVFIVAMLASVAHVVSLFLARAYQRRVTHPGWHSVLVLLPVLVVAAGLGYLAATEALSLGPWALAGLAALCAALVNGQLNAMCCRDDREFTRMRKRLASARRYFEEQLRAPRPQLRDAWLPYLLAFGLGPHVDRWFRSYGGASARSDWASSGASSPGGWTGGGGSFAGGGVTGSWAAAVSAVAAGVTAASSSGDSGGGGGGSSGGGGGGGW